MEWARFGIFAFSPSTGELWRDGVAVRLQAQPARVLAALVARPGAVVTREALRREVWGEATHVDFDRGLNFCIAQVRSALGDSAESPRFIETIPKQGYRFIAPVSREEPHPAAEAPVRSAHPHVLASPRHSRMAATLGTLAVLLIAAALVWARAPKTLPAVIVVPFYNETGRPEFDPLARSMSDVAIASLAAPGRIETLSVIGNAAVLKNPFARTDVQQAARDLDAQWVLIGQLKSDGARLRVIAHLIRAGDMKHVWAQTFDDDSFELGAQTRTGEAIASAIASTLTSQASR